MKILCFELRLALCLFAVVLGGCNSQDSVSTPAPRRATPEVPSVPAPVQWTDVTAQAGLNFQHVNGAFGLKFMPETMGSGCAFFDFDGDGKQDIFLVNGRDWTSSEVADYRNGPGREHASKHGFKAPAQPPRRKSTGALYRNNGDGTFSDVTRGSGLEVEMQGFGVAAGDYDNDGREDLLVTSVGRNYLFHNKGGGKFEEVAGRAGVQDKGWPTSAAWIDYDRDGLLDLFVCHYIDWSPALETYHSAAARADDPLHKIKSYAGPDAYKGTLNRLFHNEGGGRFADVSAKSGVQKRTPFSGIVDGKARAFRNVADARAYMQRTHRSEPLLAKALGVVVTDYDNDGWPDLIVANDTVPTFLMRNNRDGTFTDMAVKAGLTASEALSANGGMGIDAADIDQSGRESVVIGYYADQLIGLYHNVGSGLFEDKAAYAEMGRPGRIFVEFGTVFTDIDNDGWPDVLVVNGHVMDDISKQRPQLTYAQRPLLFLNRRRGDIKFAEIGLNSGAAMSKPIVGRGLACADYDLDGDVDALITTNGGPVYLLRNSGSSNRAIRLTLQGTRSNRSGLGAVVLVRTGKTVLRRVVRSGSSYLSQSELPLTIGLGQAMRADSVTVQWPSGAKTELKNVPAQSSLFIREGQGIIRRTTLSKSQ